MFFHIIASGSKGNATIIKEKDTVILIDMGITLSRLEEGLGEIRLEVKDIDAAIFTHNHSDHINGLRFIPIKKQYALEGSLPSNGYHIVHLYEPFVVKDLKITPIKISHDAINPCGFVVESENEKLVYITDTGIFLDECLDYIKNPDYLILESNHDLKMLYQSKRSLELKTRIASERGHLCNEDSALAAKDIVGNKTKEIVLAHISEECNTPSLALEAYQRVFSFFHLNYQQYNIRVAKQYSSLSGGKYEN